jgi:putative holliday junction resolvase
MNILGIDWGKSKIGLAIAEAGLAEPYRIIENGKWELEIKQICEENKIEKIIIGISEAQSGRDAKDFGVKLNALTEIPVEYFDETLTTHDALVRMKEGKSRKQNEDSIAAAIILQNYLDSQTYV